ncbi:uncharacterized protein LOC117176445 [Belonocnema kinseyi]|uniref:uncharacterized protein LOC117176445 n=1 Tax=Belonocnema kinseyi TaxID=2817044 RepID=UPI00143E00CA|nr:uncharacterized protein LOC117176445 [Belonocnema kinseyi]
MDEVSELGDSLKMAEKRLFAMERKREKLPELNEKYIEFMNDYQDKQHMMKIPEEEVHIDARVTYLPYHAVFKEGSTTTKLRVVFDGSARNSSRLSLNEVQRVGPVVQNDLFSITLRFRQYPIVLSAYIAQMYRQIKVTENQQDLQRILWRKDPSEPIQHFRLTTVTYVTATAPF